MQSGFQVFNPATCDSPAHAGGRSTGKEAIDVLFFNLYNTARMKRFKLIANPAAGTGGAGAAVSRALELFARAGADYDVEFTIGPKEAARVARAALQDFDAIVVVGGDGTVNEVLPAMLHSGKPLGVIPAGSGNDFIKALNIPRSVDEAVRVIVEGRTKLIDAGRINDAHFINGVGIGFDAAVNRASHEFENAKRGVLLYIRALLRTLGKYDPVMLTIAMNNETFEQNTFLLSIGNGTTCGGGFRLTPLARLDDQLLDVTLIKPLGIPSLLWHLPKVFQGTIGTVVKYASMYRTAKITIKSAHPVPVHVDGEQFSSPDNVYEIEVLPKALTVIGNFEG